MKSAHYITYMNVFNYLAFLFYLFYLSQFQITLSTLLILKKCPDTDVAADTYLCEGWQQGETKSILDPFLLLQQASFSLSRQRQTDEASDK